MNLSSWGATKPFSVALDWHSAARATGQSVLAWAHCITASCFAGPLRCWPFKEILQVSLILAVVGGVSAKAGANPNGVSAQKAKSEVLIIEISLEEVVKKRRRDMAVPSLGVLSMIDFGLRYGVRPRESN